MAYQSITRRRIMACAYQTSAAMHCTQQQQQRSTLRASRCAHSLTPPSRHSTSPLSWRIIDNSVDVSINHITPRAAACNIAPTRHNASAAILARRRSMTRRGSKRK